MDYISQQEQRARQIIELNKTAVLDGITKKYVQLFKALEDYDFVSVKGTEEEERNLSTEIAYLLQDLGIKMDDAKTMFDEHQSVVEDWKNECR